MSFVSNLFSRVNSYFYPAPKKMDPEQRAHLVNQYDEQLVDYVYGDTNLDALSTAKEVALFQKIRWLYLEKQKIPEAFRDALVELLKGKVSVELDLPAFKQTVLAIEEIVKIGWFEQDLIRLAQASQDGRPALVQQIVDRTTNIGMFMAAIEKNFQEGIRPLAMQLAMDNFPQYLMGKQPATPEVFKQLDVQVNSVLFATGIKQFYPPALHAVVFDSVANDPELLPYLTGEKPSTPQVFIQLMRKLGALDQPAEEIGNELIREVAEEAIGEETVKAVVEEMVDDVANGRVINRFMQKYPDADRKMINRIVAEYFSTYEFGQITEEFLQQVLIVYNHKVEIENRKPAIAHLLQLDTLDAPAALTPATVEFLSNEMRREILFNRCLHKLKEIDLYRKYSQEIIARQHEKDPNETDGCAKAVLSKLQSLSAECEELFDDYESLPAGPVPARVGAAAAPQDAFEVMPINQEQILFKEKDAKGADVLHSSAGWSIIDSAAHNGFSCAPSEIITAHERDFGDTTRVLLDKTTKPGRFKRVIVDPQNKIKGTEEDVHMRGTKGERTAQIDNLLAIWMSRLIAKTILSGDGQKIDFRTMQHWMEYFGGVDRNDVSGKYANDPRYLEAQELFKSLVKPLMEQIGARIPVEIIEKHQAKGERKADLVAGLSRIKEAVDMYRKWAESIDFFLAMMEKHPEMQKGLGWFIEEVKKLRPLVAGFVQMFPAAREFPDPKANGDHVDNLRRQLIRQCVSVFLTSSKEFNQLKLARNALQITEKSLLLRNHRAEIIDKMLNGAARRKLESADKVIKDEYKRRFNRALATPAFLLWLTENEPGQEPFSVRLERQFGKKSAEETIASLQELKKLEQAMELVFPNVFQINNRVKDCFEGLYKEVSDLSAFHFTILEGYSSAARAVNEVEWYRSKKTDEVMARMNAGQAIDFFFPNLVPDLAR